MSEERHEKLTVEEIKQRLRTGWTLHPWQPGLQQAARELIRPIVEKMDGQEIIYVCRTPKLVRVKYLETDDAGFRAVAIPVHDLGFKPFNEVFARHHAAKAGLPPPLEQPLDTTPFDFGAQWEMLRLHGAAISMNTLTDHFHADPAVVAKVKAAIVRQAGPAEISAILG
jgi:hypothetical protein